MLMLETDSVRKAVSILFNEIGKNDADEVIETLCCMVKWGRCYVIDKSETVMAVPYFEDAMSNLDPNDAVYEIVRRNHFFKVSDVTILFKG